MSCKHLIIAHGSDQANLYEANVSSVIATLNMVDVRGKTIVFCSRRSLLPDTFELEYSATKAACLAVCKALYNDGVNITALCPGWVESEMANRAGIKSVISMDFITHTIKWLLTDPSVRIPELLMEPAI